VFGARYRRNLGDTSGAPLNPPGAGCRMQIVMDFRAVTADDHSPSRCPPSPELQQDGCRRPFTGH
jgi:hypothetical protein